MKQYINITPEKYRCELAASCPAVLKTLQSYYIIGKAINAQTAGIIEPVGSDEAVVEVAADLLEGALAVHRQPKHI